MNNIDSQKSKNKLLEARDLILNFKFKEALDILNKYKKESEYNASWHCIWGCVFIYKNQIQKAFEYYESIYKKFENNPDFLFYYSRLLYWKRDYKKSIEMAVKGYYLIVNTNKSYKKIYQNYFKILSEAPVFSSPIPTADTLFPGYIPKYNDNSNKDRIKIEKKYKNHKEFRMYIISIMKEYEILSDNFIYFGSNLKNDDLYVYNIDKYDEYKIVFTKGLIDYTLSLMNISTKVFLSKIGKVSRFLNISLNENKIITEIEISIAKDKQAYNTLIKILSSEFSCPENSILYKLEKNKITKCIEFGNKKPLIIYFNVKTFNNEFPQREKFTKMIKHLYENYDILPGFEGLENDIKYFIFLVNNIKDAKLSIDNYIFKNTELFEINYIESLEDIGIKNEKLLKKYY